MAENKYRAAFISDLHLGTRGCNAEAVLRFLRESDFETLYIVGDLIDIWSLRRSRYWPQSHNDVIQKILRKGRKGTRTHLHSRATMTRLLRGFRRRVRQPDHHQARRPPDRRRSTVAHHPRG